ncbi:plasmid stabilization protein [Vitiosangium sp. GDMCC 1.1324]|uniref:plasmid stabilization protein n=1 Tax=Vitiosangium sp. (strain GDMCC 1.1324) TaxID=2138576 RepID=UPI000D34535E|nr:plasmid stabilization protein [Vitiosangium sp. GDMCC 1.1324]PTL75810.1 plasmid stabilization protein [Vitiosangium sp. GDMCC 1.1324]
MPPRGVKSPKRTRQYEKIKQSARKRGTSTKRAKEIAARTVNKQRSQAGETKGSSRRAKPARTTRASGGTKSRGRVSASGRTGRKSSSASRSRKPSTTSRSRKSSRSSRSKK